ncbi:hypothetical protein YC2023_041341 [Brassica napus]|uniref:Uncharacterized protein n=1 Tax=Brassica oleracea TaxID=3712 RepID=A0A3P6BBN6_BRAOL|nr:unnamed protein product [Brassica oleracea]
MCPNFLRHLLALLVKAREEGLLFGLNELHHLVLMKRNNQNLGPFLCLPVKDVTSYRISHIVIKTGGKNSLSSRSMRRLWEVLISRGFPAIGLRT